ncbi:Ig-like domain-containing protein [Croceivirga radicis]|uniref:Ig-like domain-containing protein n=1 Tax=Croceivirga radicis TaxID=1929488 RepID=UPI001141017C|nr:hypothetical protein [Croceivirga radicis]
MLCVVIFTTSCNKDSELFDTEIEQRTEDEKNSGEISESSSSIDFIINDDTFHVSGEKDISILNVLGNDTIPSGYTSELISLSTPKEGIVSINDDNTINYEPIENTNAKLNGGKVNDEFQYTLKVTDTDGNSDVKNASVNVTTDYSGELKAFPGAFGFGKNATGGRGGIVYKVTNLNDEGEGSLRYGVEQISEPRTIVFEVSGYINAKTPIRIKNGNITIAGQSAPSKGICIRGASLWIEAENVIVRYLKIRPGKNAYDPNGVGQAGGDEPDDGIRIVSWPGGNSIENIIIDHCSVTWAHDGILDITSPQTDTSVKTKNISIQNCLLAENIDKGYGVLVNLAYNVSFYNNLIAHTSDRNVAFSSEAGKGGEMINNFVYGTIRSTWFREGNVVDFVGNKYVTGPNINRLYETYKMEKGEFDINQSSVYIDDCIDDGKLANWNARANPFIVSAPNFNNDYDVKSAISLGQDFLSYIGDNLHRDEADQRIIDQVINETGNLITHENQVGGYPSLSETSRDLNFDSDNDGISDIWEVTNFGSTLIKPTEDLDGDGYTIIEEYLNSLVY